MKKNLPDRYFYPAVFIYEDGQEIAVDFPTSVLPPAARRGRCSALGRELLGCVMCGLEEDGEPIPAPSALSDIHPKDNERVVLVDAYMPSVRPGQRQPLRQPHGHSPGVAQRRSP